MLSSTHVSKNNIQLTNYQSSASTSYLKPNFKLTWKNLSIWVKKKNAGSFWSFNSSNNNQYQKVLNDVSGFVDSGTLLAIIGTSGAGKTTLLTSVSQRINGVSIGDIKINNISISRKEMKDISGFLPQHELASGFLTISEHLHFTAKLKFPQIYNKTKEKKLILTTLGRLGLTEISHSKICVLSGGELKKLCLAEQLLTDPPLLFCDEPTTGLDSYNAEMVIKILHDLSFLGKAVVCSIHQPTYKVFEMFDFVTFLTKGVLVYHGPTQKFSDYFNEINIKYPMGFNPVEYYISHMASIQNDAMTIQKIRDLFDDSKFGKSLNQYLNNHNNHPGRILSTIIHTNNSTKDLQLNQKVGKHRINFFAQLYWLSWRNYTNMIRNNKNILLRFTLYMFIALLLSTMYWNIAKELEQKDVQNIQGLFYLITTETIFTFAYSVLHTFPEELPKLLREVNDGLYDSFPYYVSKVLMLIPVIIIETLLYSLIIFWSVGFEGGFYEFTYFYLPILCCAFSSTAYGFALSTTFKSVATASLVSIPIDFFGMTYSGFYIQITNLPWITAWLPYTSQFYYGTEAISINFWETVDTLFCDNPELPCYNTGKSVLLKYGFQFNNYAIDLIALFTYFFMCHVLAYISFKRRCSKYAVY